MRAMFRREIEACNVAVAGAAAVAVTAVVSTSAPWLSSVPAGLAFGTLAFLQILLVMDRW